VDVGVLLQVLLAGLSAGAVLGLVGLGFSLVAGTARVLPFAHGDVAVAAVFTAVVVTVGRTPVAQDLGVGHSVVFVALALVTGALVSGLIALLVVRPYRDNPLGWVAGGVAAGLLLRAVLGLVLPAQAYAVPDPLHLDALSHDGLLHLPGGTTLPVRTLGVLALGLLVGVAAEVVLVRGRFGRSLRAVADDPDAAALCGVDPTRVLVLAFVAAGALAGLAGMLDAPSHAVSVDDGVVLGLEGIAAAVLGGLGSLRGALLAGLVLGVTQQAAVHAGGAALQDVVPLGVLVVLLALRPEGLFRRARR
jgi:branched-subunit amino acid ABC-type transport system permease component